MANPSLLIIPDRYKAAKLYSQLPESGDGDFVVTRGTTATRVNASGLIESVASGVPRLDYTGGGCPSLLVEPAATNSIRNNTGVGAVTGTPGTLPTNWQEITAGLTREVVGLGTENGVDYIDLRYSGTASAVNAYIFMDVPGGATSSGTVHALSVYINQSGSDLPLGIFFGFEERSSGGGYLREGATQVTPTAQTQRLFVSRSVTNASVAFARPFIRCFLINGATYDFTIRIGLPQMELGSVATSVIKTSTVAVTRNADVISLSSASGFIGQSQGVIYAEVNLSRVNTNPLIVISDGSNTNRIQISFLNATSLFAIIRVAGANESYSVTIPAIPASGGVFKIALGYAANNYCFALNGTTYADTTSRGVPACNKVGLGTSATELAFLNDRISAAAIYTTRLDNATLESLTTL